MNYKELGLTFKSPFDVLAYHGNPNAKVKKRDQSNRRSKKEQMLIAMETQSERRARYERERNQKMANILKNSPYSVTGYNLGKTNSEVAPR